jgi:hypothetical protein
MQGSGFCRRRPASSNRIFTQDCFVMPDPTWQVGVGVLVAHDSPAAVKSIPMVRMPLPQTWQREC